MKKQFSKAEKATYFKTLRKRWQESKDKAENDELIEALYRESGLNGISILSFGFVMYQMQSLGLDGFPYIDMKTFKAWKESGFKVVKEGRKISEDTNNDFKKVDFLNYLGWLYHQTDNEEEMGASFER